MRKAILFLSLLLIAPFAQGQNEKIKAVTDDTYNFKITDSDVVWQFVYLTDKAPNEIFDYFQKSREFKITNTDSLNIYGRVEGKMIDYKKYGYKKMSLSLYVRGPMSYDININIKSGKYRVIIQNVTFISTFGLIALSEVAYNTKEQKFTAAFLNPNSAAAAPLSSAWHDAYSIKDNVPTSDDW